MSTEPRLADIRRIAFVTRRFEGLQGLKTASVGAGLLFGCLIVQVPSADERFNQPMQALMFASVTMVLALQYLEPRYRMTFGNPIPSSRSPQQVVRLGLTLGLVAAAVVIGALMADMLVQAHRPGPSVVALLLASLSLFIVVRDWPWRAHHLVGVAGGLAGAIVVAVEPPTINAGLHYVDPARGYAFVVAYSLVGLSLVAAGLCDHHLLASSLRPAGGGGERIRSGGRDRLGLTKAAIAGVFCAVAAGSLWWFSPVAMGRWFPLVLSGSTVMIAFVMTAGFLRRLLADIRNNRRPASVRPMNLDTDTLLMVFLVALAATIDRALASSPVPMAIAVAIGGCSAWTAVRDWPDRKHDLLRAVAAAIVVFLIPLNPPARALPLFVFAVAGALTVEALIDYWKAPHVDTI